MAGVCSTVHPRAYFSLNGKVESCKICYVFGRSYEGLAYEMVSFGRGRMFSGDRTLGCMK
jgi:hypothetical protein